MGRRYFKAAKGRVRRALPPLYGKHVELAGVNFITDGAYQVRLLIDGLAYEVRWFAKDELAVMMRLMEMQEKRPRSAFHAEQ